VKTFTKPENLNGAELMEELAAVGIVVEQIIDFANGTIGFETDNDELAAEIVGNHNGNIIPSEPTIADKLAFVGLNVDDLKVALGLNG